MKRSRRGFSLAEVLIAIAILAVLCMIGAPAAASINGRYRQMELDDTSRQIFLAVQNELTARSNAGTLDDVFLPGGASPDGKYWMREDSSELEALLPDSTLHTIAGEHQFAISCDVNSGSVLEVYYTQQDDESLLLGDLTQQYGPGKDEERKRDKVGFYDGSAAGYKTDEEKEEDDKKAPKSLMVDIINGEDLTVEITIGNYANCKGNTKLTVIMEELDLDGKPVPGRSCILADADKTLSFETIENAQKATVMLDERVSGGRRFSNLFPNITPGANIRVSATLEPLPGMGLSFKTLEDDDEDNSLFANRDLVEEKDTLHVANPRHLQNLEDSFSAFRPGSTEEIYVEQTEDIDWPGMYKGWTRFASIQAGGWLKQYNGNGLKIKTLYGYNGLFDRVNTENTSDCTLEDICLENPYISGNNSTGMGVLAGVLQGTPGAKINVTGCRSYKTMGALASADAIGVSSINLVTGGLIGSARHANIEGCYIALERVESSRNSKLGGFAGSLRDCTVKNCYANAKFVVGTVGAAGFVGDTNANTRISHCYAVGNIDTLDGMGCGFAAGDAVVRNSYCVMTHVSGKGEGAVSVEKWNIPAYGFSKNADNSCVYWKGVEPQNGEKALGKTYEEMKTCFTGSKWGKLTGAQTFPFDQKMKGKAYPFPAVRAADGLLPFHGGWPVEYKEEIRLFATEQKDDKGGLQVVLIPTGGTRTFYAQYAQGTKGGTAQITAALTDTASSSLAAVTAGNPQEHNGRTPITVKAGEQPGLTYVTLTCDQKGGSKTEAAEEKTTLRAVVVVYRTDLLLNMQSGPKGSFANSVQNISGSAFGQQKQKTLRLDKNNTSLTADCRVTPEPKWADMAAQYGKIAGEAVPTSFGSKAFEQVIPQEKWIGLQDGAPTLLEDPNHILIPSTEKKGLWATHKSHVGNAVIQAAWAMDPAVLVKGPVVQIGSGVVIKSAELSPGEEDIILDESGNQDYPETVAVTTLPGQKLTFNLTTELAEELAMKRRGTYQWSVLDADGNPADARFADAANASSKNPKITLPGAGRFTLRVDFTLSTEKETELYTDELELVITEEAKALEVRKNDQAQEIVQNNSTLVLHQNPNSPDHAVVLQEVTGRGHWYIESGFGVQKTLLAVTDRTQYVLKNGMWYILGDVPTGALATVCQGPDGKLTICAAETGQGGEIPLVLQPSSAFQSEYLQPIKITIEITQ